ncbi:citrate synthase [Kitasatospora sp. NPDC052896]|uniref:citrate synthase n=1 Tax=Kitasatospora sp. NPDC052896 TaxID=3364061 RepID=UPI0037C7BC92
MSTSSDATSSAATSPATPAPAPAPARREITTVDVPRGLSGVVVTETRIGDVRGREGFYHYRQYSAIELAERRGFEDVWRLMLDGALPADAAERAAFGAETVPLRRLPDALRPLLAPVARDTAADGPLAGLRALLPVAAALRGIRPLYDTDPAGRRADALYVSALAPTLIAALYRVGRGLDPVDPRDDLGYAANYLHMLTGREPAPEHARAIEQYLISTIDHGFNASTFTARVIASTGADLAACVSGALGALSGPLHGGAPSRALDTLDAIGTPERAEPWIRERVLRGERIMGFGHPVYRTEDPRSRMLRGVAERLGGGCADLAVQVERQVLDTLAELKPGRELFTNVEYYAGVVMDQCGVPRKMFTPTFGAARIVGWCANILEQAGDSKIIRPAARYAGPTPPQAVPALG